MMGRRFGTGPLALALGVACATALSACASGPALEKYPRRELDRPYTLPEGVSTWHIPTAFGFVQDRTTSARIPPIPVPLIWESSLSDDWTLIWGPLPLGVLHQISRTESARTGLGIGMGFSYRSDTGFRLRPTITLARRQWISDEWAIDLVPSFTPDIPFQGGQDFRWAARFSASPVLQLDDAFALQPGVAVEAGQGTVASTELHHEVSTERGVNASLGLSLAATWSLGRQWDLRPSYSFTGIGSSNDLRSHIGVIEFVHFW